MFPYAPVRSSGWNPYAIKANDLQTYNFFFIEPLHTFTIAKPHEVLALAIFVVVAAGTGTLAARLREQIERARQAVGERPCHAAGRFEFGDLVVDDASHRVTLVGDAVHLTPKEFELLLLLARNASQVLTHRQILTQVWGLAHAEGVQYLRVLVGQLRAKIEPSPSRPRLIENEPGIGYRLQPPDAE